MSTKNTQVTKKCIGTIKKKKISLVKQIQMIFVSFPLEPYSKFVWNITMKYKYEMASCPFYTLFADGWWNWEPFFKL